MQLMDKDQKEVLDQLLRLAGGDFALVEEAIDNANPGNTPSLEQVMDYIVEHIPDEVAHG